MNGISLEEKSLRLRYEAFAILANEIAKAENWEQIGKVMAVNLKFVIDFFTFRITYKQTVGKITYQIFRGEYEYWIDVSDDITSFEEECSQREIPLKFDKNQIAEIQSFKNNLFSHEKVNQIFVLPLSFYTSHNAVLVVANKNFTDYQDIDYRFFRSIIKILSTKISQIFLIEVLAHKNEELANANKEIIEINTRLESMVTERTYKLEEANKELSTLFYRTSHDFRRPLTSILGLAQLAEMSVSDETALELFEKITQTVHELDKMLQKLYSININDEQGNTEKVDFDKIILQIKQKFQHLLTEKNIRLEYTNDCQKICCIEESYLFVILDNLIENSIYFAASTNPYIKVKISEIDVYIVLEVEDNGQGVEESLQKNIFEMYFRGNESSKGNGLGLYVVRKIVDKLSGVIHLESTINKGSKFTVLLTNENSI